mmetsp:Transcript_1417/g.2007  ORF Transcript_1417/g.2007 Transcript_1417/m.2007 type:complete len:251 (-) Transcript_1417:43-795(-)
MPRIEVLLSGRQRKRKKDAWAPERGKRQMVQRTFDLNNAKLFAKSSAKKWREQVLWRRYKGSSKAYEGPDGEEIKILHVFESLSQSDLKLACKGFGLSTTPPNFDLIERLRSYLVHWRDRQLATSYNYERLTHEEIVYELKARSIPCSDFNSSECLELLSDYLKANHPGFFESKTLTRSRTKRNQQEERKRKTIESSFMISFENDTAPVEKCRGPFTREEQEQCKILLGAVEGEEDCVCNMCEAIKHIRL